MRYLFADSDKFKIVPVIMLLKGSMIIYIGEIMVFSEEKYYNLKNQHRSDDFFFVLLYLLHKFYISALFGRVKSLPINK